MAVSIQGSLEVSGTFNLLDLLLFLLTFIVILIIHELIHGLFFKLFKPENKVIFGIKWWQGMAYASSPGSLYEKRQMLIIGLAPFFIWTLMLTLLFSVKLLTPLVYISLTSLHAAGCVGDFYVVYLLLIKFCGQKILVEDTETGLRIYQKG